MKTYNLMALRWPILAMTCDLVVSNIAVMYAINDWLTWGAFTYPLVFLVTDLTNRTLGATAARKVALVGFALAVVLSVYLATPQIALASGAAFLTAQLLDIAAFNRLRTLSWWKAPLIGSLLASVIDTGIFFYIAFYGSDMNWLTLAAGDLAMKCLMAVILLLPYKALLPRFAAVPDDSTARPTA